MTRAKPPPEPAREPLCPSLPPEIWIHIFSHCHDLSHLWNACRRVSPTLKACAERAFGVSHLKHVSIEFLLDRFNLGGKRGPHEPAITLEYQRLGKGDEEGVAWFSGHLRGYRVVDACVKDKTNSVIMTRWLENVKTRKPELPNYTISIGDMVNDTHIPGLLVEEGGTEYTARLEWRGMLSLFFREQARLEALQTQHQTRHPPHHPTTTSHKPKPRKPLLSGPHPHWQDTCADIRRDTRRTRLKEHYTSNPEMLWAIDSLRYFEKNDSSKWSSASPQMLPHLPGAGLGERWFGSTNIVQELYLDECSSMNRIDTQMRILGREKRG
ncbi:hypothetical protein E8E13_006160 [Curvularia kusanoi]|uniref:F-box domain-containing protein n=1 Tax=Curvularia kusanoi TaxID=90978 RepID=A0A9P4TAG7_CURKU|nr:hypothetical protein E8E13_006160 [Curvularia kusanoi]